MLTRHAPLHVPGRAEVGWLVGESGGRFRPEEFDSSQVKTAARGVRSGYVRGRDPIGDRARLGRLDANSEKKSPRADPPDTP